MDRIKIVKGTALILEGLGIDLLDPNFIDTPERVARAYEEVFAGLSNDVEQTVANLLNSTFPCDHQQMIVAQHVEVFSYCPHHLLPVRYDITVGYLPGPGPGAKVIGLSKLCRITQLLAGRPVLQEQVVNDITDALMAIPGCAGSGCIARAEHYCMRMRGVRQSASVVITNSLQGEFLTDGLVRDEFMAFR